MSETPLRNFVIDCEVVVIDPKTGASKTSQELSYRSKKDVELGDIKFRVGIYCFDLMFLNDESLLSRPLRSRRDRCCSLFPPLEPTDPRFAKWELIPCCTDNNPEKVREFFGETLKMKAEGIMVKLPDEAEVTVTDAGEEENGATGADGQDEENDYASCYDHETGASTAVTKSLSGFTDAFYKEMREKYNPEPENSLTSKTPWPEVEAGSLSPDI
ncbi:hypothetical protein JCM10296v2_007336 [Rhodotorula toruloides]